MIYRVLLIFALCLSCVFAAEDAKLVALEKKLENAQTTLDTNEAIHKISLYLDEKLAATEKSLLKTCEDSRARAFCKDAAVAWKAYRKAQAEFAGDQWRGGSGATGRYFSVYNDLTKERIALLESLIKD